MPIVLELFAQKSNFSVSTNFWPYSAIVLGVLKQNDIIKKKKRCFPIGKQTVFLTDLNVNFHYCY